MRREPGTVVIGSATRQAREREEKKKVLAEKEKKKAVEVQVPAEEKKEKKEEVAADADHISEPSDTSDVRRMKESKFVWADDEEECDRRV
ncbi:MAG: hypothetical protein L6R37_007855, partial [Teloschistes peruensis]